MKTQRNKLDLYRSKIDDNNNIQLYDNKNYFFRFGVCNLIGSGFISDDEASDSDSDSSDSAGRSFRRRKNVASPTDYKNKDESAEDFFYITELADESAARSSQPADDYDDIEEAIPAATVSAEGMSKTEHGEKNGDDKDLMPPPPQNAAPSVKVDDADAAAAEAKSKIFAKSMNKSDQNLF